MAGKTSSPHRLAHLPGGLFALTSSLYCCFLFTPYIVVFFLLYTCVNSTSSALFLFYILQGLLIPSKMRTSTVQRSHRLSTKLLTLSLLCAIITVLQSQAVSSHQLSPSTHRLRVRADPAPTPAQPPAPPTTAPLPKAPIDPIQCGLTFEPGFAPGEQAGKFVVSSCD